MSAGDSAAFESQRQRLLAAELDRLAIAAKEMERRFAAAAHSERRLSHTLEVLEGLGYTVLADRRWPKSRRAQVDFIVAGPGGVFIVDATCTLVVRLIKGDNVSEAHRSHAYQYASRQFGGHLPITLSVTGINVIWLLPIAALVALGSLDGFVGLLIAYVPLIFLALRFKAGQREG